MNRQASRSLALLLLITGVLALAPGAAAQTDPALNLARRLLGPWGDPGGIRVELAPQALPEDLPGDLPLPEDLDIVGSLANYGPDGELLHAQIVLDSPHSADDTQRMLEASFSAEGWMVRNEGTPTGFVPMNANVAALYCAPDNSSFIHMNSFGISGGITDVRLELNTQTMYSPCNESAYYYEQPQYAPFPTLNAPAGSQITLHGGNYLEDQASSSAMIRTDLPADELLRHFETQLEQAGWTRDQEATAGRSVWTRSANDSNWRGVLEITNLGTTVPNYYAAFVVVQLGE